MVAGMDVERARNSYLGKKMLEQMESKDSDFAKFVAMTGFDPRRDLREVILASPDANSKNSPLILVRGVFDQSRINGFLWSERNDVRHWTISADLRVSHMRTTCAQA